MTTFHPTSFLRAVLLADAAASGATGLLMALFAGLLAGLLNLPSTLLVAAGIVLLPYAAAVAFIATRDSLRRPAIWTVIACNLLWAADCVLIAVSGWIEPNALGYAFILAQALIVFAFAELQYVGLRGVAVA
jgi:hypothetical protein